MWLVTIAAEVEATHSESGSFPQFDFSTFPSQIFWLALSFGVLYLALSRSVLPKLGGIIEKRGDTIAHSLDEAAKLNDQAG